MSLKQGLMTNKDFEKAEKYAKRLLRIRPRSESELAKRLYKKGFDRENIDHLIKDFKTSGLVDDLKFSKLWVRDRLKFNPKGKEALVHELIAKGVSEKIAESILEENFGFEELAARRLIEEKSRNFKSLTKEKARKRLRDYLARRGFNYSVIDKIVGNDIDLNEK